MSSHPFRAVFCPNCGTCVNEPSMDPDPLVTCGWCKGRHSFERVVLCRNLSDLTAAQHQAGVVAAIRRKVIRLRNTLADVTPVPDWRARAESTLARIVSDGDDYGDLANITGDDLRDVLFVAAEWLRDANKVLVFADGHAVATSKATSDFTFALADLYAEDYEPAQGALRRAGCHPRGRFSSSPSGPRLQDPQNQG